jgi:hypothetical protein
MVWSAAKVAEEALRTVGVYSTYDVEPDPEDFNVALGRLHALTAYIVATEQLHFFREVEQTIVLEANRESYPLSSFLTTNLQYIENIQYTYNDGTRQPVKLVTLTKLEELKLEHNELNTPDYAYAEREDSGLLFPYGVPKVAGYKFLIRGRRFSSDLDTNGGSVPTEFAEAWSLCLVNLLAHNIGSGPVTTLPAGERKEIKIEGERMKRALIAYNQHANVAQPRQTAYHDL